MTGYKPSIVEDLQLDGHAISSVSLKEKAKREFVLYARIDEKPHRRTFKRNSEEAASIREKGGAKMPVQDIEILITQYFIEP